jgi:CelD/BcsL family acetyltransferase involved in cellulose biosynthesis
MSSKHKIECLSSYDDFQGIRADWDEFITRYFEAGYGRTHAWLSAWWKTYHYGKGGLIYIERNAMDGRIVAAVPVVVRRGLFSGFPARIVRNLGSGIGPDEFLISPDSKGFLRAVFSNLQRNASWDVALFHRVDDGGFLEGLRGVCNVLGCTVVSKKSEDYLIRLPVKYSEYLKLRSQRFRRTLNNSVNRLKREGVVNIEFLNPFLESDRVLTLGQEVARASWQFQEGISHFNDHGGGNFYTNLFRMQQGTGGEEFNILTVDGRPIAYLFGCRRGKTYYAVDTAYHSHYEKLSAGRILFNRVIQRLIESGGVDKFDFEGGGDYKDHYASDSKSVSTLVIYNKSLYANGIRYFRQSALCQMLRRGWGRMSRNNERRPTVEPDANSSVLK